MPGIVYRTVFMDLKTKIKKKEGTVCITYLYNPSREVVGQQSISTVLVELLML